MLWNGGTASSGPAARAVSPPSQQARAEKAKGGKRKRPCCARYRKDSYAKAIARACERAWPLPPELARAKVEATRANGRKCLRRETKSEWRARLGPENWRRMLSWRAAHRWHPTPPMISAVDARGSIAPIAFRPPWPCALRAGPAGVARTCAGGGDA